MPAKQKRQLHPLFIRSLWRPLGSLREDEAATPSVDSLRDFLPILLSSHGVARNGTKERIGLGVAPGRDPSPTNRWAGCRESLISNVHKCLCWALRPLPGHLQHPRPLPRSPAARPWRDGVTCETEGTAPPSAHSTLVAPAEGLSGRQDGNSLVESFPADLPIARLTAPPGGRVPARNPRQDGSSRGTAVALGAPVQPIGDKVAHGPVLCRLHHLGWVSCGHQGTRL